MKSLALILISIFCVTAFANENGGVAFSVGAGMGKAAIENPDQTKAHYKVLALQGRGHLPLFDTRNFDADFFGSVKYLDLENTSNTKFQSEVANLIGPGAGLELRAFKFVLGGEYNMMLARHYAVGNTSRDMKYEMNLVNVYGGLNFKFNQLSVSLSYSQSTGTVPKASSGLAKSSPYNDQIYWLQLTYSTGASFSRFLQFLF